MKPYNINYLTKTKNLPAATILVVLAFILVVVLVVVVLGLFFRLIGGAHYSAENFISAGELKARSAAMPAAPDKICEQPGSIKFVGQNYSMCCPDGPKSPNCLCQLPGIKTCQQLYKDCLDGQIFSKASRDFLGEENIPASCQIIMDSCISSSGTHTNNSARAPLIGMKPDPSTNSICSIDGYKKDNLAEFCGQICHQIPGCQYYQTDALMGSCGLFNGQPIALEKGAAASSLGNYQLFTIPGTNTNITEGFTDGQAAQFCLSGAVNNCSTGQGVNGQNCLCSHSIIADCQKLNKSCLSTGTSTENCRAQFGACCGLIDTANTKSSASMSEDAKMGNGLKNNILCSRREITTLADCKSACLKIDQCEFIKSNLASEPSGLTNDGLAPYCHLFKGSPLSTPGFVLGQQPTGGKTIYMKLRGNPDEREINAELAKK